MGSDVQTRAWEIVHVLWEEESSDAWERERGGAWEGENGDALGEGICIALVRLAHFCVDVVVVPDHDEGPPSGRAAIPPRHSRGEQG